MKDILPNMEFVEAVSRIINEESEKIAQTHDETEYYEEVGERIVAAYKATHNPLPG